MAGSTIPNAPSGQKTSLDGTEKIPISGSQWVYISTILGGWTAVPDTWTYDSASTIVVPTDATATYRTWMRIRFKQGGAYKYYIARTVAATLITVMVNTDYTVANAAITDIAYSIFDAPLGFPQLFNFTTGITYSGGATSPTSNTVGTATYSITPNGVVTVVIDSALIRGSGDRSLTIYSLPFTCVSTLAPITGVDTITATSTSYSVACYGQGTTIVYIRIMANDGSYYINGSFRIS